MYICFVWTMSCIYIFLSRNKYYVLFLIWKKTPQRLSKPDIVTVKSIHDTQTFWMTMISNSLLSGQSFRAIAQAKELSFEYQLVAPWRQYFLCTISLPVQQLVKHKCWAIDIRKEKPLICVQIPDGETVFCKCFTKSGFFKRQASPPVMKSTPFVIQWL